jgi:hypothetical protein
MVEAARYRIRNNKPSSKNGDRFWELSGGILFCEECGNRMQTHTSRRDDKAYPYYRCTTKSDSSDCGSYINAGALEAEVWEAVLRTMDDKGYVLRKAREHFEKRRRELSRLGADAVKLTKRLEAIETSWVKFQRAYEADAISVADLAVRREELDTERERVKGVLEKAVDRDAELERLSEQERAVIERLGATENVLDDSTPQKRRELYQDLRVRVDLGESKRPQIWGIFRTRRLPCNEEIHGKHTIITVKADTSQRHSGSLTGPIDHLTRAACGSACPKRTA